MLKYAEDMNIFEDSQHGFMQGKSCLTNLLTTLEDITSCLDEGDPVDVIFLDNAKSFDSDLTNDWLESYRPMASMVKS